MTRSVPTALPMILLAVLASAGPTFSQPSPRLLGDVAVRPIADFDASFREALRRPGERWVAWTFDATGLSNEASCRIDLTSGRQHRHGWSRSDRNAGGGLALLGLRAGRLAEIEIAGAGCEIDARVANLEWWQEVTTQASFALLDRVGLGSGIEDVREAALMTIANHDLPAVDSRLESLATDDRDAEIRRNAIFWLGAARGRGGYEALRRLEDRLPAPEIAERLVFPYHVSEESDADLRLLELAREHPASEVRSQALF